MASRMLLLRLTSYLGKDRLTSHVRTIHGAQLISIQQNTEVNGSKVPSSLSKNLLQVHHNLNNFTAIRWGYNKKSKSRSKKNIDSDDEEEEEADNEDVIANSRNSKMISASVNSMRIDAIIKAGFAISRNKAETVLYDSKLRINGHRVSKKGQQIALNDTVDMVQGPSPKNPKFLIVDRITILNAELNEDNYRVKILREKNLLIENYEDGWKPVSDE